MKQKADAKAADEEVDEFADAQDMSNEIFKESVEIDAQRGSEKLAARLVHALCSLTLRNLDIRCRG